MTKGRYTAKQYISLLFAFMPKCDSPFCFLVTDVGVHAFIGYAYVGSLAGKDVPEDDAAKEMLLLHTAEVERAPTIVCLVGVAHQFVIHMRRLAVIVDVFKHDVFHGGTAVHVTLLLFEILGYRKGGDGVHRRAAGIHVRNVRVLQGSADKDGAVTP